MLAMAEGKPFGGGMGERLCGTYYTRLFTGAREPERVEDIGRLIVSVVAMRGRSSDSDESSLRDERAVDEC